MTDMELLVEVENVGANGRNSRPSLAQLKSMIEYIQKRPDLAHKQNRCGFTQHQFKKLWRELANILNAIDGTIKTDKGWIKYWADKRRFTILKQRQIDEGKSNLKLTSLEKKILELCKYKSNNTGRKKCVKLESCNGNDGDSLDEFVSNEDLEMFSDENDDRHLNVMEQLVNVMAQQVSAMSQVAQAQLDQSKSLERLAEASHIQALAVDRLANSFENISSSVHDVRNALLGIEYTMKRCMMNSADVVPQRQNTNLFS